MLKRIVFLPYHGYGHINPCLPIAAILREAGHTVSFAGVAFFRQHLLQQGYPYHTLQTVPFGMNFERWHNRQQKKTNLYRAELYDRRHDTLYHSRHQDLLTMLDTVQPDIILLDALQATDFVVLYPYLRARNIAIGITYPLLPPDVLPGRPPHNSDALPGQTLRIGYDTLHVWLNTLRRRWRQKLIFLGYDDRTMVLRRIRRNHVPAHFYTNNLCLHPFRTANLDELILAPREFDFPGLDAKPRQHYVGFLAPTARTTPPQPDFDHAWNTIRQARSQGRKLIYCSFGTTDAAQTASIHPFLKNLAHIAQQDNHLLVIAAPDKNTHAAIPQAKNIFVFSSVPQLIVLTATDVFITHGGMNSVKESIQAGVPMLLYPIHADYDPRGNAARITYHALGLRGDITRDTRQVLQQKIQTLLENPAFKANIRHLQEINAAYTPQTLLTSLVGRITPPE